MKAEVFIKGFLKELKVLKEKGDVSVSINILEKYLGEWLLAADNPAATQPQDLSHSLEVWKTQENIKTMHQVEMFKSVTEAGLNAIKSAIIINGGAAVALLAFMGGLLSPTKSSVSVGVDQISYALLIFLFGTGFAGCASGVRYLCQFAYSKVQDNELSNRKCKCLEDTAITLNFVSISLGIMSFAAFFYGGWMAHLAFK